MPASDHHGRRPPAGPALIGPDRGVRVRGPSGDHGARSAPHPAQVQQRRHPPVRIRPPGPLLHGQQRLQRSAPASPRSSAAVSVKTRTPYQACSGAPIPASVAVRSSSRSARTSRPSRLRVARRCRRRPAPRPSPRPGRAASPARRRCARAGTAARRGPASAPAPRAAGPAPRTYISTPWQSTTSKLPGRKCTPVSRPSPSMIRTRSRMPSGSAASASRAAASIVGVRSSPVT